MFKPTIALFDLYLSHLDAHGGSDFNRDLGLEVKERLEQLDFIVSKVMKLEQTVTAVHRRFETSLKSHIQNLERRGVPFEDEPDFPFEKMTVDEMKLQKNAVFEMSLLTETFYYIAGRIRTILRNSEAPIPGLTRFECVGVRNTRNHLLEHAEGKDSRIFARSFGCGASQGPVIKAMRSIEQKDIFPDRGLYRNAEEFRTNLERLLELRLAGS